MYIQTERNTKTMSIFSVLHGYLSTRIQVGHTRLLVFGTLKYSRPHVVICNNVHSGEKLFDNRDPTSAGRTEVLALNDKMLDRKLQEKSVPIAFDNEALVDLFECGANLESRVAALEKQLRDNGIDPLN